MKKQKISGNKLPAKTRKAITDKLFEACQKSCCNKLVKEEYLKDDMIDLLSDTVPVPMEFLKKISDALAPEWGGGSIMIDELIKQVEDEHKETMPRTPEDEDDAEDMIRKGFGDR